MVTRSPSANSENSTPSISAPTLALPEGGGAIRGLAESFEFQDFSGTVNLAIGIPAPPARALTPGLRLSYCSGGGNGPFGMGFNLTLPSIARKTSNGIPRYNGDDIFVLADESELAPLLIWDDQNKTWSPDKRYEPVNDPVWEVQVWRPRRERQFDRLEQWTQIATGDFHWRILTAENVVHSYGRTANARIFDPEHPDRVFQWLIEESHDALGNKVRYNYKAENEDGLEPVIYEASRDHRANRYISQIDYGNYLALGQEFFAFQIIFDYGEFSLDQPDSSPGEWLVRTDPFSSYRSGFEIRTLRLCRNILVRHCFHNRFDGKPVLTWHLVSIPKCFDLSPT